jgi:arylsulfatase A-like enzyme
MQWPGVIPPGSVSQENAVHFDLFSTILDEDIGEKTDVAEKFPEIYRDLKARHLQWLRQFAK